jgi:hypothetical protein
MEESKGKCYPGPYQCFTADHVDCSEALPPRTHSPVVLNRRCVLQEEEDEQPQEDEPATEGQVRLRQLSVLSVRLDQTDSRGLGAYMRLMS